MRESWRSRWRRLFRLQPLRIRPPLWPGQPGLCSLGLPAEPEHRLSDLLIVAYFHFLNQARNLGAQRSEVAPNGCVIRYLFDFSSLLRIPVVRDRKMMAPASRITKVGVPYFFHRFFGGVPITSVCSGGIGGEAAGAADMAETSSFRCMLGN